MADNRYRRAKRRLRRGHETSRLELLLWISAYELLCPIHPTSSKPKSDHPAKTKQADSPRRASTHG